MEWQAKVICAFVAGQAGIGLVDWDKQPGGRNPLVDAVNEISIFPKEKDARERELDEIRGPKVADRLEDDPRLERRVAADPAAGVEAANPSGSFEAMVAMMSGGARPAMPGVEQAAAE